MVTEGPISRTKDNAPLADQHARRQRFDRMMEIHQRLPTGRFPSCRQLAQAALARGLHSLCENVAAEVTRRRQLTQNSGKSASSRRRLPHLREFSHSLFRPLQRGRSGWMRTRCDVRTLKRRERRPPGPFPVRSPAFRRRGVRMSEGAENFPVARFAIAPGTRPPLGTVSPPLGRIGRRAFLAAPGSICSLRFAEAAWPRPLHFTRERKFHRRAPIRHPRRSESTSRRSACQLPPAPAHRPRAGPSRKALWPASRREDAQTNPTD